MWTVDGLGRVLIEYRRVSSKPEAVLAFNGWSEIVVGPIAMTFPEVEVLVAASASWLSDHFQTGGGG
jgi:hypothetical protein